MKPSQIELQGRLATGGPFAVSGTAERRGARRVLAIGGKPEAALSIEKMIAAHPDVDGDVNVALALAVRHAMFCAVICTSCADACAAEKMDMRQCIRSCLDCADICTATMKVATRRTAQNIAVLRQMLETCIATCESCAAECERHDNDHCRICAEMCRECARDCRSALPTVV